MRAVRGEQMRKSESNNEGSHSRIMLGIREE
jgi:hypothetical protein